MTEIHDYQYADFIFKLSQEDPKQLNHETRFHHKNIHQRLYDLMVEGKSKQSFDKNLNHGSMVLRQLVEQEKINHLIIKLYPGNEGYSIGVKIHGQDDLVETMKLPYEESELLDYVDNEELPPVLVDLIENSPLINAKLFHEGCLVVQVIDFRRCAVVSLENSTSHWVLLRPTTQSIINDVMSITSMSDSPFVWRTENKLYLESQLIYAAAPPLCLEPNVSVGILANKLHRKKQMFKDEKFIRNAKRKSQIAINKAKKCEQLAAPRQLKLFEFLKNKDKIRPEVKLSKKINYIDNDSGEQNNELVLPKQIGVNLFAKQLTKPDPTPEISYVKVEEYTMEFIEENRRSITSVTILHRSNDDCYFGQLYVNKHGQNIKGSTCIFPLGTIQATRRYLDQFTEILTENGRKSVKITRQIPGQIAQVSYTQAASSLMSSLKVQDEDNHIVKKQRVSIDQSPVSSPQITVVQSPVVTSPSIVTTPKIEQLPPPSGIQQIDPSDHQPNIQATASLPTGVSLASLSLAPVQQNLRLHNLVSITPQGYVPISLMMTTPPSGQQPALMTTTPGSMIVSLDQNRLQKDDDVSCGQVTYATTPTTVLMSAGNVNNNVLSVPIGVAGSLGVHTQFITNQMTKATGQQIKAPINTPQVSLLQMTAPQTVTTGTHVLRPLAPHTIAPAISGATLAQAQTQLIPQQQIIRRPQQQQPQQIQFINQAKPARKRMPKK